MTPQPLPWLRWYWPAVVVVSVAAYVAGTFAGWAAWALLGGTVAIAGPELWFCARRQWQDTLSDWWWRVFHIRGRTPVPRWGAPEALGLGLFLAVAVRADITMARFGYWACAGACVVSVWLPPHLFRKWWR